MSASILVAYATRYGSTQEVAESIAATLRDAGLTVEFAPMREVKTLEKFDAVVLGAPIYIGKWHQEAHQFLSRHQAALTQRPVAIFALGPLERDEVQLESSNEQFDQDLLKYLWLKPVAKAMFVGKYDPAKLTFPHNLLTALPASPLKQVPASDHRDWDNIRAWASELPAKIG